MKESKNNITSADAEQLFEEGTIILFKCGVSAGYPTTFVSGSVEKILGFPPAYFLENEHAWSDRIHPDDRDKVNSRFDEIIAEGGSAINEYRFKRKDGREIWLRDEIKIQYNAQGKPASILGTSFEITDRKNAELEAHKEIEQELRTQLSYQQALAQCSTLLLANNEEGVIQHVLEILLDVTGTDRAFFFTTEVKEGAQPSVIQKFEAVRDGAKSHVENPDVQEIPYENYPMFFDELSKSRIVNIATSQAPQNEQMRLKKLGVQSVLLLPVFIEEDWFGFIGFDSNKKVREWDEYELLVLKTAAEIMGTFLKRTIIGQSLVEQKSFNRQMLDKLPSIVVIIDMNMNLVLWNKAGERLTGYSNEELANMSALQLIAEEDHEELRGAFQRIMAHKSEGQELRLKHKKGTLTPYYWLGSLIEMNGEEVFLNIGLNISPQKEMERELREEKRFVDAVINGMPGTFFMLDEDLNYVRVNDNMAKELGYSIDELMSGEPLSIYPPEQQKVLLKKVDEVLNKGFVSVESSPISKDGKKLHRNLNAVRFDRDGETFILGTGQDISDLKQREKELEVSNHEKQVLLQEIHHRVKNNLAVISGLLELQLNEYDDPTYHRLILESQSRIRTMAMIHEKLYQSENLSKIPMLEYVEDLVAQIRKGIKIGEKQISIDMDIEDIELNINQAIPFALAINEILSNALEHAFKNQQKGKVVVELHEEGDFICSSIHDNGQGMKDISSEQNSSLGMTLIRALLTQIDADWKIEGEGGVAYTIRFKKYNEKDAHNSLKDLDNE